MGYEGYEPDSLLEDMSTMTSGYSGYNGGNTLDRDNSQGLS